MKFSGKLIIVAIILLSGLVVWSYISLQKKESYTHTSALEVIPSDVAFFFEVNGFDNLKEILQKKSDLFIDFLDYDDVKKFNYNIKFLDSLITKNNNFEFLADETFTISFHLLGNSEYVYLIAIPTSKKNINKIIEGINKISDTNSIQIHTKDYDGIKIFYAKNKFAFADIEGIFVFSPSELYIEKAIRQKNSYNYISTFPAFKNIMEKDKSFSDLKLWINFENLSDFLILNIKDKSLLNKIKGLAEWSVLNTEFKKGYLRANGYIDKTDLPDKFLYIFKDSKPVKFDDFFIFPDNTAFFTVFLFNDIKTFYANYEKYLYKKDISHKHKKILDDFKKGYGIDLTELINNNLTDFIAFVYQNNNLKNNESGNIIIFQIKDRDDIRLPLIKIIDNYAAQNSMTRENFYKEIKIEDKNFVIYKMPVENIWNNVFDYLYDIPPHKYFTFSGNYMIWTDTYNTMLLYLNRIVSGKNLGNSKDFIDFIEQTPVSSNFFFYSNMLYSYSIGASKLKGNLADFYKKRINPIEKIRFFSIKISNEQDIYSLNLSALYNRNLANSGFIEWAVDVSGEIITKPLIITNAKNNKKNIFFQTSEKNIYLINPKGEKIWIKKIPEKIIGQIYKIDLYNNGKYQIAFATENFLYILDINGNLIENFPVKLPARNTKGLFYYKYDGKKSRFFIIGSDNKIYLFDNQGKIVKGWNFSAPKSTIKSPVKHFVYKQKDYIVFADDLQLYILNRKGKKRIEPSESIPFGNNPDIYFQKDNGDTKACFITNDAVGNIHFIDLTGKVSKLKLKELSPDNVFVAADLDGDGNNELILTDKRTLYVYNLDGKKKFIYNFDEEISFKPIIFRFAKDDKRIGITDKLSKKIYLFDKEGHLDKIFPLQGTTAFSITMFDKKHFNLITGKENFLYNYRIF